MNAQEYNVLYWKRNELYILIIRYFGLAWYPLYIMVKEKQCINKSYVYDVLSWFSARLFDSCDTQLKEILLT